MHNEEHPIANIARWIDEAANDPAKYLERQATEILLVGVGKVEPYGGRIYLKGGVLMGIVYESPRQTADIDFSCSLEPDKKFPKKFKMLLDESLVKEAAKLGYPDIICRVQSVREQPRSGQFSTSAFPALKLKIAYARRGSPQERNLNQGRCSEVLNLDISFNEPIGVVQVFTLEDGGNCLRAYSLFDLIAEKIRALLQQPIRNRNRRQDVYDLTLLIKAFPLDAEEKNELQKLLLIKCKARDIEPDKESLSSLEIKKRAQKNWETLELELKEVPQFEGCFKAVSPN